VVSAGDAGLARFHDLSPDDAEQALLACCACASWARVVAAGRPYPDRGALRVAAVAALGELSWPQVRQALDAHPRIGERRRTDPASHSREQSRSRGQSWSRQEQSAVDSSSEAMRQALAEANAAYESRFGHIFLIAAAGRSDVEMLEAARLRLRHDDAVEREVVRTELATIAAQRVERLLDA
jgi:2-oxo-4-hydroxy-4-carboxy-5-ureidoimidazoline decarboxylase